MALVAIMGAQGTGKTVLLNALKQENFNTIERKSARSILTDWNRTLDEVYKDPELTMKFQDEILDRKIEDEKKAVESEKIWFTERCYADLFTYALVSLGKENIYSDWLNEYYDRCLEHNQSYKNIYYLTSGHFKPVQDGVRSFNSHYQRMVDLTMLDVAKTMSRYKEDHELQQLIIVTNPQIRSRVMTVINYSIGWLDVDLTKTYTAYAEDYDIAEVEKASLEATKEFGW